MGSTLLVMLKCQKKLEGKRGYTLHINEVIVVEGKDDTTAIKRAVGADTIETNGSAISEETFVVSSMLITSAVSSYLQTQTIRVGAFERLLKNVFQGSNTRF